MVRKGLCSLRRKELGVGLHAGVRKALGASFVEAKLSVHAAPRLRKLTVGRPFAREPRIMHLACGVTRIGDKRQHLVEVVLKEVVVCPGAFKAMGHDPICIVDGEAKTDVENAKGAVVRYHCLGKNLVHEPPVLGNDTGLEPREQALARPGIRPEGEREQAEICGDNLIHGDRDRSKGVPSCREDEKSLVLKPELIALLRM